MDICRQLPALFLEYKYSRRCPFLYTIAGADYYVYNYGFWDCRELQDLQSSRKKIET
jgi:hypothetical protein